MPLTPLGWLIAFPIAISVLLIFLLRSKDSRKEQLDLETSKARLEGIGTSAKFGKSDEAEGSATKVGPLSQSQSLRWGFGQELQGTARTLLVAGAVFLLVAGTGAAISYLGYPPKTTGSGDPFSLSRSGPDGETLARLENYTRSIGAEEPASTAPAAKLLPDVNTMIERLAARLKTTPADIKGWRMLGWSYFNTGRYEQAATAYAKAVELDPNSADLKLSYDEAKAKAGKLEAASSSQTEPAGKTTQPEAVPPREHDAAIRSMVDGLANRLESSPRDVEGWTRLMRSRVVLGETEVAATAYRKALEVFKDDKAASGKITAAAIELGLKAE